MAKQAPADEVFQAPTPKRAQHGDGRKEKRVVPAEPLLHRAELDKCAERAHALVPRIVNGETILKQMSPDNENRAEYEELWRGLVWELYECFRDGFMHLCFVRVACGTGFADDIWNDVMPSGDDLTEYGIDRWKAYWPKRVEPPYWIMPSQVEMVSNALWPPRYRAVGHEVPMDDFFFTVAGLPF